MTVAHLLEVALAAYEDLGASQRRSRTSGRTSPTSPRHGESGSRALIDERGSEPVTALEEAAIGRAIDEIGRISDPHRAIDWLSTFPQVVLVALGERA